jgi:hypothetical protein
VYDSLLLFVFHVVVTFFPKEALDSGVHVPGYTELVLFNTRTHKADPSARVVPRVELPYVSKPKEAVVKHYAESIVVAAAKSSGGNAPTSVNPAAASGASSANSADKKAGGLWAWIRGDEDGAKGGSSATARGQRDTRRFNVPVEHLVDESDREPFCDSVVDLEGFMLLQRANGRWLNDTQFTTFLVDTFGLSRIDLTAPPRKLKETLKTLSLQHLQDVWATAIAVQVLQRCYADAEPNWAGMCAKAKGFL